VNGGVTWRVRWTGRGECLLARTCLLLLLLLLLAAGCLPSVRQSSIIIIIINETRVYAGWLHAGCLLPSWLRGAGRRAAEAAEAAGELASSSPPTDQPGENVPDWALLPARSLSLPFVL